MKTENYSRKECVGLNDDMPTPYYIFDHDGFVSNLEKLEYAMKSYYPNYALAYSYKTNYTPYICKLVKTMGGYAEVVSDMELELALKIGYPNSKIIYNGPAKGKMLEEHILNGGITNIDNMAELERVISLSQKYPNLQLKVGLRINVDIGANFISRFGFDVDSSEIFDVVAKIRAQSNLELVGLHMHVSRARNLEAWQRRIDKILEAADKFIEGVPEYIDLGSGMFAEMEPYLKNQFNIKVPSYEEYAKIVAGTMMRHYEGLSSIPILFTEPGTTVVARYLSLFTKVIGIKTIKSYKIAMVDSDYHQIGETGQMMKCPYTIYKTETSGESLSAPLNIVGFTCLEQDVLFRDFPETLSVGDIIEFRNVGGYSIVYKPPFIQPNCPIYAKIDNNLLPIKRAETFEDIFSTFIF